MRRTHRRRYSLAPATTPALGLVRVPGIPHLGVVRDGRHGPVGPHVNVRSVVSIEVALKVRAYRRKETADITLPPPVALCRRGRRLDGRTEDRVAA